jgi:hypothetical protein
MPTTKTRQPARKAGGGRPARPAPRPARRGARVTPAGYLYLIAPNVQMTWAQAPESANDNGMPRTTSAQHGIAFSHLDLVLCRNVLIPVTRQGA